jgi:HSP20 family protein
LLSRRDEGDLISPRLNVAETEKSFEVEAELPGVKKEDIKVAIENRRVSIEGEAKRESAQKEGENVVYAERSTENLHAALRFPPMSMITAHKPDSRMAY